MQGRLGFSGLDIVSAAMTPPATVLDSGERTFLFSDTKPCRGFIISIKMK